MSLFKTIVGVVAELTDQPNPYDKRVEPSVSVGRKNGRKVLNVTANNYLEAINKAGIDGTTPAGNVHYAVNHVGRNKWEIVVEDNRV